MKWLAIILKKDIVAKTVPGTRGSHQFIRVSQVTIKTKCVSEDEFYLEFNLTNEPKMCIDNLQISQFILCKYDHLYCIGMACETDIKNRDVRVKLMHPFYQSRSYRWPIGEDFYWVPNTTTLLLKLILHLCLLWLEDNTSFHKLIFKI